MDHKHGKRKKKIPDVVMESANDNGTDVESDAEDDLEGCNADNISKSDDEMEKEDEDSLEADEPLDGIDDDETSEVSDDSLNEG